MGASETDGLHRLEQTQTIISQQVQLQLREALDMARTQAEKAEKYQKELLRLQEIEEEQNNENSELTKENDELGNEMQDVLQDIEDMKQRVEEATRNLTETRKENEWLRLQKKMLEDEVDDLLELCPSASQRNGHLNPGFVEAKDSGEPRRIGDSNNESSLLDGSMKLVYQALRNASRERAEVEEICNSLQAEKDKLTNKMAELKEGKEEAERRAEELSVVVAELGEQAGESTTSRSKSDTVNWVGKVIERRGLANRSAKEKESVTGKEGGAWRSASFDLEEDETKTGRGEMRRQKFQQEHRRSSLGSSSSRTQMRRESSFRGFASSENPVIKLFASTTDQHEKFEIDATELANSYVSESFRSDDYDFGKQRRGSNLSEQKSRGLNFFAEQIPRRGSNSSEQVPGMWSNFSERMSRRGSDFSVEQMPRRGSNISTEQMTRRGSNMSTEQMQRRGSNMSTEHMQRRGSNMSTEHMQRRGSNMSTEHMQRRGSNLSTEHMQRRGSNMSTEHMQRRGSNMSTEHMQRRGSNMSTENMQRRGSNMFAEPVQRRGSNMLAEPVQRRGSNMSTEPVQRRGSNVFAEKAYLTGSSVSPGSPIVCYSRMAA